MMLTPLAKMNTKNQEENCINLRKLLIQLFIKQVKKDIKLNNFLLNNYKYISHEVS